MGTEELVQEMNGSPGVGGIEELNRLEPLAKRRTRTDHPHMHMQVEKGGVWGIESIGGKAR